MLRDSTKDLNAPGESRNSYHCVNVDTTSNNNGFRCSTPGSTEMPAGSPAVRLHRPKITKAFYSRPRLAHTAQGGREDNRCVDTGERV